MKSGLAASSFSHRRRPVRAIVVGGLIVGVLDLVYAIAVYSPRQPILIPQTERIRHVFNQERQRPRAKKESFSNS